MEHKTYKDAVLYALRGEIEDFLWTNKDLFNLSAIERSIGLPKTTLLKRFRSEIDLEDHIPIKHIPKLAAKLFQVHKDLKNGVVARYNEYRFCDNIDTLEERLSE